ncbi:MAG: decarboxylating NADP(+)-dependent phosphogluconate dehydrogenase [Spirochaetales bacterium]|nr:decarboxylating NADP(+)-dependent phosphogluconate dehydrogenase [Spirochaetales bacterium]
MIKKADIGLIGLAVMGQNLVLNMNDHGYSVAVFNRTVSKTDDFLNNAAKGRTTVYGTRSLEEFIGLLSVPRKIVLMVKAGEVVDTFIESLIPHLEKGDLIIDGGNSNFRDTIRRTADLNDKGLLYIGTGISGGEEGARHGPSIMPGGNPDAWPLAKDILQAISAKTDKGEPCCDWVGSDGAGHYVKMVHNGIEYADMQIICECYHLLLTVAGLTHEEMQVVFAEWNRGDLSSYLIEITAAIMERKDDDGKPLLEKILDAAGQKGTGKWSVASALDFGAPATMMGEAVFARCLSAMKEERVAASGILKGPRHIPEIDRKGFVDDLRRALLASKIVSYAQGFMLMREASKEFHWDLDYGGIALLWREGCIIRSVFLQRIKDAFEKQPDMENILCADYFRLIIDDSQASWRRVIAAAVEAGIPVPALSSALAFYDGYRSDRLPANLIQALRDYFGAHTYRRIDRKPEDFFHTDWTGKGGDVAAGTYTV